jgi:Syntaxin
MRSSLTSLQLLQSDRRGNAQSTLRAVQDRHREIQKIERMMVELAQLFQDLDAVVIQQEAAVENIEQQGEQVEENVAKANVHMDGAIDSARAARRKKFWCLGIARKSAKLQPHSCSDSLRYSSYHHHHSGGCCCRRFSPSQVVFHYFFSPNMLTSFSQRNSAPAPAAAPAPTTSTAAKVRLARDWKVDHSKS